MIRHTILFMIFLLVLQMCYGSRLCGAEAARDMPVNESVIKNDIKHLTHVSQEYYEVWLKISRVQNSAKIEEGNSAAQHRTLLRMEVVGHLRKLLAQSNRKKFPEIPRLELSKNLKQPFRSGMDPAGITDEAFRNHYEDYLKATQQSMKIMAEKEDLESLLRLFGSLFVTASKNEIGLQETKALVNEKIQNPKFRNYLLALFERLPIRKR